MYLSTHTCTCVSAFTCLFLVHEPPSSLPCFQFSLLSLNRIETAPAFPDGCTESENSCTASGKVFLRDLMQHCVCEAAVVLRVKGSLPLSSAVVQSWRFTCTWKLLYSEVASTFCLGFCLLLSSTLCWVLGFFSSRWPTPQPRASFMHNFVSRFHSDCGSLYYYPEERKALRFHFTACLELLITFIQVHCQRTRDLWAWFPW